MRFLSLVVGLGLACATAPPHGAVPAAAGPVPPALEERLGYPRGSRLLILHFDDLGTSRSGDAAAWAARERGLLASCSVIVPGPLFSAVATYVRAHPDLDLGIHLALTSEWPGRRWGPVSAKRDVPTLLARDSLFREEWSDTTTIRWQDVDRELRAQIDAARAAGIRPTHLDVHEFVLYTRGPILFEILRRVAQDEALPILSARDWVSGRHPMRQLPSGDLVLSRVISIAPDVPAADWDSYYTDQIRTLPPGVSELILHPAMDSTDVKALTLGRVNWGAAWRARDWAFVSSRHFRRLLRDEDVHLVTWRQIDSVLAVASLGP